MFLRLRLIEWIPDLRSWDPQFCLKWWGPNPMLKSRHFLILICSLPARSCTGGPGRPWERGVGTRLIEYGCFTMLRATRPIEYVCFTMLRATRLIEYGCFTMLPATRLIEYVCFTMLRAIRLIECMHFCSGPAHPSYRMYGFI